MKFFNGVTYTNEIVNSPLKSTHHHHVGYFSNETEMSVSQPDLLTNVGFTKNFDVYTEDSIVNFSYDSADLLVQEQSYIYSADKLPVGYVLLHAGLFYSVINNSHGDKYPIDAGKTKPFYMFSDVDSVTVKTKKHLIAYADKEFDSKNQLVQYIENMKANPVTSPRGAVILKNGNSTQIIVYENGLNLVSFHLRSPLVSSYNLNPPFNLYFQ